MTARQRSSLVTFGFFTAVGLLLFGYKSLDVAARGDHVNLLIPLVEEVTGAWTAAALVPLILRMARRYPISLGTAALHVGGMCVFSAAHTCLMWITRSLAFPATGLGSYNYGIMRWRFPMEFFHDVIVYWTVIALIHLWDSRVRAFELEGRLATARLENLRLQLQPHFLFNALNTISSVMYEDPRRADGMISRLSDLLRSTLEGSDAQEVPLEDEMRTLDLYLEIMRQRFEEKLQVNIRISPEAQRALVPQLLLQPLVENSIRHGSDPQSNAVSVTVTAERAGDSLRLQVRDRGRGMPAKKIPHGTGLSNTAERLNRLYGSRHRLDFENPDGGGLLVTVVAPYHT